MDRLLASGLVLIWRWSWLVLAAGCHPQHGASGSDFSRVVTPHFTVYSDVSQRAAETHARKLEITLQGLLENGWEHRGKLPLKLNIVLLKDPADLERYAGLEYAGYFRQGVLFEPWAVLPAPRGAIELQVLIHELSHHLAYLALQNQPFWFSEGLAGYYETARVDAGTFVLGSPGRQHYRVLARQGLLPSAQLFALDVQPTQRAYATAWLLVHYLMSRRGDDFVRYQEELGRGKSYALAWAAAFPDLRESVLDATLQDYYTGGGYAVLEAPISPSEISVHSAPLRPAEEEALRALLWQTCVRCTEVERAAKVQAGIQRALALDPKQVDARLLSLPLLASDSERHALLVRLTQDAPQDYRPWLGLALLADGDTARSAVERALALAPEQPGAWMAKARYQWSTGNADVALTSAEHALRLNPTALELLDFYAQLLFRLRRCADLADVIQRMHGIEHASLALADQARLSEMSHTCGAGAAAP